MLSRQKRMNVRIIPRLDVKGPNLVKGIHLEGLRVLGLPERFSEHYYMTGADELIYMDIVASLYGRNNLETIVRRTAANVFIPITVGGGIRSIADIRCLLRAGADKVAINTAAIRNPALINEAAKVFGSQCIVVSIEAIRMSSGKYEAFTDNGRESTGKDAIDWAREAAELGAGEVLITSVDREGTGSGYDLELVAKVTEVVSIPVIAHGGAGNGKHVEDLIRYCDVGAASASSIFHYDVISQMGVEKRNEGNIEYLKKFVQAKTEVLKRIDPISIPSLKSNLAGLRSNLPKAYRASRNGDSDNIAVSVPPKTGGRSPFVVLVDYGRINLFSVECALKSIGARFETTSDVAKVAGAEKLVIAGVGAFGDGMRSLCESELISPIQEFAASGRPILGICLGMQLFMSEGEEFGTHKGLDLIKGRVTKLKVGDPARELVRIPHIGWNQIEYPNNKVDKQSTCLNTIDWSAEIILKGVCPSDPLYFLHSYVVVPDERDLIIAETQYGPTRFCSVIRKDNLVGCQFHPERSGSIGQKIYRNFVFDM